MTPKALKVCGRCPVQAECLHTAMTNGERWGTWGGVTARGRRRLARGGALLGIAAIATSLATIAPTFADTTTPAPTSTGATDVNTSPPSGTGQTTAEYVATHPLLDPANANVPPMKRPAPAAPQLPPGPPATTPAGDAVKAWHAANDNAPVTGGAAAGPSCS